MLVKETLNNLNKLRKEWLDLDSNAEEELLNKCPVAEISRRMLYGLSTPRARYNYSLDTNVAELIRAAYKIASAYSKCNNHYYIATVDTSFSAAEDFSSLVYISVLASLNEVTVACDQLETYYNNHSIAYTKNDTGDNAYVYIPTELYYTSNNTGDTLTHPVRIIMHRNSNRNEHINDACTVLANKLIDYINESPFTIHKFTNEELMILDALELTDVDAFYTMLSKMFGDKRLELMDAAERAKLEFQQKFYEKFNECSKDFFVPKINDTSDKVPMRNGDLSYDYRQRAENIQHSIQEYYKEINKLFLELDKVNNELKACLFEKTSSLRGRLIQVLNNIYSTPNSFLKTYNLTDSGELRLCFMAPILYWEADEVNQWVRSSFHNKKYVELITSKRFQLWCNATVRVDNRGISGSSYETYEPKDIFYLEKVDPNTDVDQYIKDCLNSLRRADLEALAGYEYYGHTIKHGHVGRYSCFGNNESTIVKAFREGNYDLALNVIIHCVTQINLTDSIVVEWFCNELSSTSKKCIYDTETSTWYKPNEALAILKSENK